MKKRWLLVISVYSIMFIASELTITGFALRNSTVLTLGLFSIFGAFGLWGIGNLIEYQEPNVFARVFSRAIQGNAIRESALTWLYLHKTIQIIEGIAIFTGLATAIASAQIQGSDAEAGAYYFIWFLLFAILVFPYFHKLRNILGMGYHEIEGGSFYGARSFARLATNFLNQQDRSGEYYLSISLEMLKGFFKFQGLSPKKIDDALKQIFIISRITNEIPYKPLFTLSNNIGQQSSLSVIPETLDRFINDKKLAVARNFEKIEHPRQFRIKQITLISIFLTALGTVIQAIMPESLKEQIVNSLSQFLGSQSTISFLILLVLVFVLFHYISLITNTTVKIKDLREFRKNCETNNPNMFF